MSAAPLLAAFLAAALPAPQRPGPSASESIAVVLGPELSQPRIPGLGRGRGWRRLWSDSVRLPLRSPGDIGSGLSQAGPAPSESGVAILAWDAGGLAYRLLTVDRDPTASTLPPHLRGTGLERVLRDLVATNHPTAPLLAATLYRAAGLDAMEPELAVLRDDDHLADAFRRLSGQAVWIERAPELDGQPYDRFLSVITTDSLLALLRADPAVQLDLPRFLAARLLDLVLGDRDRSPGHWLWGLTGSAGAGPRWSPLAIRQEEALLNADGWSRLVLSLYSPGYGTLNAGMPDVAGLAARSTDFERPLLARLEWSTWDSVWRALSTRLTDTAIAAAAARLPAEHREASAAFLTRTLAARRDALPRIAAELYRLVATYPDVELSDASEQATLRRGPQGEVELLVRRGDIETVRRVFRPSETEELRLHLEGGDDEVRLEGVQASGVGVRITSSHGSTSLERVGPGTRRVVLYAQPDRVRLEPLNAVRLVPGARGRWLRWQEEGLPPVHPDWGHSLSPLFKFSLSEDLGLVVGGGVKWRWFGFGEPAHRQRLRLALSYASKPSSFTGEVGFERRSLRRNLHFSADVRITGADVVRYFGYGNTSRDTASGEFYRAGVRELTVRPAIAISRRPELELRLGPVLRIGSTDTAGVATLVASEQPYGSGRFNAAGLEARLVYAPDRGRYEPGVGLQLSAEGSCFPGWLDVSHGAFGLLGSEVRMTWVPRAGGTVMVASRLGGSLAVGTVPFRMAPRLGGPSSLRGYKTSRFTGDQGAGYGALELRLRTWRFHANFLTGDFGMLLFGDAGRVWQRGESNHALHTGGGGGFWIAPALGWIPAIDALLAHVEVATSAEGTIVSLGTGFRF